MQCCSLLFRIRELFNLIKHIIFSYLDENNDRIYFFVAKYNFFFTEMYENLKHSDLRSNVRPDICYATCKKIENI